MRSIWLSPARVIASEGKTIITPRQRTQTQGEVPFKASVTRVVYETHVFLCVVETDTLYPHTPYIFITLSVSPPHTHAPFPSVSHSSSLPCFLYTLTLLYRLFTSLGQPDGQSKRETNILPWAQWVAVAQAVLQVVWHLNSSSSRRKHFNHIFMHVHRKTWESCRRMQSKPTPSPLRAVVSIKCFINADLENIRNRCHISGGEWQ